jgi:hypothetical protein
MVTAALLFLLAACTGAAPTTTPEAVNYAECTCPPDDDGDGMVGWRCEPAYPHACTDCDCDGWLAIADCDDNDFWTHPGASEGGHEGVVCRDDVSDGQDNDCDGVVDEGTTPMLGEVCGNGADDDCDGVADEGCDSG